MERIASFSVDHLRLSRGVFVSRTDRFDGVTVTTLDIRMKEPNREPVIDVPTLHSLEHLGATYVRNDPVWKDRIVYFGPMGCRTGLYLLLAGAYSSRDVLPFVKGMMEWIASFSGPVPGASPAECGNWSDQNPAMAAWEAVKYLHEVLDHARAENLEYPT